MKKLTSGTNGERETETRNEDPTTALLTRLRGVFYDSFLDPAGTQPSLPHAPVANPSQMSRQLGKSPPTFSLNASSGT
jgi:hypothetical protein